MPHCHAGYPQRSKRMVYINMQYENVIREQRVRFSIKREKILNTLLPLQLICTTSQKLRYTFLFFITCFPQFKIIISYENEIIIKL